MSVSGPSPLGTLMVQRVEAALGVTLSQQANIATGARPDAVTQPGQPDKIDPVVNPPPKEHEGGRRSNESGGRQAGLAALIRNDPEIAKLLAARNAPMTSYTASAPTSLGQAAKAILALLLQFPDARPAVAGRAPLLNQAPAPGGQAGGGGPAAGGSIPAPGAGGAAPSTPPGTNLDPQAVQALSQRSGSANQPANVQAQANTGATAPGSTGASGGATAPGSAPTPPGSPAVAGQAGAAAAAAPPGNAPSLAGMAGQLATALAQALQGSGIFYESHLREFAFGQRTLAQVQSEPQAQAGQQSGSPAAESTHARGGTDTASGQPANAASQASQGSQAAHGAQASQAQASASAQSQAANLHLAGALLGLDPSTHALVRQQLETLANQAFAWQGEPWPGAEMEWEVQRRHPDAHEGEQAENWATRLNLSLPGLGEVQARLSLAGNQLVMHLVSPDGASLMADHTESLRNRLAAQGLQLSHFTISREQGSTIETGKIDSSQAADIGGANNGPAGGNTNTGTASSAGDAESTREPK